MLLGRNAFFWKSGLQLTICPPEMQTEIHVVTHHKTHVKHRGYMATHHNIIVWKKDRGRLLEGERLLGLMVHQFNYIMDIT